VREPEPEVVARAAAGDLAAFEELVRASQGHVYRFVLHIVRNRATAEDVTQEAFLHAFRALPRFRGASKFTTWLYRIARNAAVDAMRRGAHQRRLAERMEPPDPAPDPGLRAAVREAVDDLPPELREPFVLIEVFGLSYREASKVLGVPQGTLKSRMFRARRLLMTALEAEERADEV
jgi:RNA polymerase sigma-70 factor, ECF subfamily